jgi:hypothetical protein
MILTSTDINLQDHGSCIRRRYKMKHGRRDWNPCSWGSTRRWFLSEVIAWIQHGALGLRKGRRVICGNAPTTFDRSIGSSISDRCQRVRATAKSNGEGEPMDSYVIKATPLNTSYRWGEEIGSKSRTHPNCFVRIVSTYYTRSMTTDYLLHSVIHNMIVASDWDRIKPVDGRWTRQLKVLPIPSDRGRTSDPLQKEVSSQRRKCDGSVCGELVNET